MIPCSFTPLTRNIVTGVLLRRRALRKRSWRFWFLSDTLASCSWRRIPLGGACAPLLFILAAAICGKAPHRSRAKPSPVAFGIIGQSQKLQFAVQGRALHADEG